MPDESLSREVDLQLGAMRAGAVDFYGEAELLAGRDGSDGATDRSPYEGSDKVGSAALATASCTLLLWATAARPPRALLTPQRRPAANFRRDLNSQQPVSHV